MTPEEKAKFLINEFYELTDIDTNITDTMEQVNQKIVEDFLRVKRIARKCAELLQQANLDYYEFYEEVKTIVPKLGMEDVFEKN